MKRFLSILTLLLTPFLSSAQNFPDGLSEFQFDGDHFYAVANKEYRIVKLDQQGDLVHTFGNSGRGPGEFQNEYLKYVLHDSLIYIADGLAQKVVIIDKHSFESRDEITVKKNLSNLIIHQDEVFGVFFNYEKFSTFDDDFRVISIRPIDNLQSEEATLFEIKESYEINPLYDQFSYTSSNSYSVITNPFKNKFYLFDGNSLESIQIPLIEDFSLGDERNDLNLPPNMIHQYIKSLSPRYVLVRSAFVDANTLYFHVQSHKTGKALISYDILNGEFKLIGSLYQGRMMGINAEAVFTFYDSEVKANSLSDIHSCSDNPISIYLSDGAFDGECAECKSSLLEWFEFARTHHIPVRLFLEDTSWFGKKDVMAETIHDIQEWDIWGEISYTKECTNCFESEISIQISDSDKIIPLPTPISTAQNHFSCFRD